MNDDGRQSWWLVGVAGIVVGVIVAGLVLGRRTKRSQSAGVAEIIGKCETLIRTMQAELEQLKAAAAS